MGFPALTLEQQKLNRERAQAARAAKNAARKASKLRRDFLDKELWDNLARDRGLRLPPWGEPPTVSNMRTWLHKVGLSQLDWEKENGCKLVQFPIMNPQWPLRSFAGLTLEFLSESASGVA